MIGDRRPEQHVGHDAPRLETEASDSPWLSTRQNASFRAHSAPKFFSRRAEGRLQKSVVLGLACEEYFRRNASGEAFDRSEFFREFPDYQQSVARLLAVYDYLKQNSLLPDRASEIEIWPEPGETVAGYELLDGLGLGAFSRVFLAAEPAAAHRRIAVKVSAEGAAEAEILGKLSHPNIVPVYAVRHDEQRGWTLICMPYKGQAALDDVIGQLYCSPGQRPRSASQLLDAIETINRFGEPVEPVPPDPQLLNLSYAECAVHLTAQLADALAYAHAKGICHRDLKPSNVLMAPDGRPMLLDFNLSQDRSAVERRLGGTLPYMAPEQLDATVLEPRPGPAVIDPRSDLFSLGVIAYELLCGEWPYGPILPDLAPDEFATELHERQRGGPTPLLQRNPDVDPKLSDLIQRCLAFDADARPQTALELAAELRRSLSLPRRLGRRARAHPLLVAFAAGVVLTNVAGWTYHFATREPYGVRELRAARAALTGGDVASAQPRLDNAVRHGVPPDARGALADAFYRTGKLAYEKRDYDTALAHLSRAADLGLNDWQVWFYRGATHYRLEKWNYALDDYQYARRNGAGVEIDALIGDCVKHIQTKGYKEAALWYQRAIENGVQNAALFNSLGLAVANSPKPNGKHFDEAAVYFESAIRLNPELAGPYFNLAYVRYQRQVFHNESTSDQGVLEAADAAMRVAPNNPRTTMWSALTYSRGALPGEPRWETALDRLWRAYEVGFTLSEARNFAVLKEMTETLQARPGFDELIRNQPKEPEKLVRQFEMLDALGY